jgi:alanine racemase
MRERAVSEVNLAAIGANAATIREMVGPNTALMAVVKADAYGHGSVEVSRAALSGGAYALGVATVHEAVLLRSHVPDSPIFVLPPFAPHEAESIVTHQLIPLVSSPEQLDALSAAAKRFNRTVKLHIEIDTGMGRSGVQPDRASDLAASVMDKEGASLTGLATHFASAGEDVAYTERQLSIFSEACHAIQSLSDRKLMLHAANSAGVLCHPESRLDMVRAGLLLYGIVPPVLSDISVPLLTPVMTVKTQIALIRVLPEGHSISYGQTHTLRRQSRIATLPIGYGDGYPRELSNRGEVLIQGRRAPILGRVCMDVTVVDVTDIPQAVVGDEVVLIGQQGKEQIRAEEIGRRIGTTEHEITTRLLPRLTRVYV